MVGGGTHHVPFGIKNEFTERSVVSAARQHEGQQLVGDVWLAMRTTAGVPDG
jgi:hypothetical protein